MGLELNLVVVTPQDKIERELLKVIIKGFNKQFRSIKKLIKADLAIEVPKIFKERDATGIYNRLVNGPLNLDFGFIKGEEASRVDAILDQIGKSIQVEYKDMRISGSAITIGSGFTIKILKSDFVDILGLPEAKVRNMSKNPKAHKILHWLDWLLLQGDSIIIAKHSIKFIEGKGRSGGAVMIQNKGNWKVPVGSSGSVSNNWLTKEVKDAQSFLEGLSLGIVEKHIKTVVG